MMKGRIQSYSRFERRHKLTFGSSINSYLVAVLSNQGGISLKPDPKSIKSDQKRLADFKGKVSVVFYAVAIPLSFVSSWLACGLYVVVAVMWLIPDRRIEQALTESAA